MTFRQAISSSKVMSSAASNATSFAAIGVPPTKTDKQNADDESRWVGFVHPRFCCLIFGIRPPEQR